MTRSAPGVARERKGHDALNTSPDGPVSLFGLFDGRRQLIIYRFMLDPTWDAGCTGCSGLRARLLWERRKLLRVIAQGGKQIALLR
jgi:predicted dithiol-disulfide oxidoreductase (DUF899 family)